VRAPRPPGGLRCWSICRHWKNVCGAQGRREEGAEGRGQKAEGSALLVSIQRAGAHGRLQGQASCVTGPHAAALSPPVKA
jgi:hypothetical protein